MAQRITKRIFQVPYSTYSVMRDKIETVCPSTPTYCSAAQWLRALELPYL